ARTLEPKASAVLRDQLIAQLKALNSPEEAADWAHRVLASKNTLVLTHAEQVELAFQLKLSTLMTDQPSVCAATRNAKKAPQKAKMGQQVQTKRACGALSSDGSATGTM